MQKFEFSQILLGDKNATSLCSKNICNVPEHSNGDGRQQQRDGGGLNDHLGLQDHLGLLDQRVLGLPSLTYPFGI